LDEEIESVASHIVASDVRVHTALGPGLLESAYQRCMNYELRKRGLKAEKEKSICLSNMMEFNLTLAIESICWLRVKLLLKTKLWIK
jgi:GxxExxY protein